MFSVSAETIHDRMIGFGRVLGKFSAARWLLRKAFDYKDPFLYQEVAGIDFTNPIGLAAGFDKNGYIAPVLPEIGFGFGEFGSITLEPHEGNPRPWLHRLKKHQSLVVHYGLKNEGSKVVVKRLEKAKSQLKLFPVGISVAAASPPGEKTQEKVIRDVKEATKLAAEVADYLTINISCPNIYNAPDFLWPSNLQLLLSALDVPSLGIPVFLKLSPDIKDDQLKDLVATAKRHGVAGFVAGNLTKDRDKVAGETIPIPGGLSGRLTQDVSDELIARLYRLTKGEMVIIGCGGVFSAQDAYRKIRRGANLIQLITGMIYEGPEMISEVNHGLVKLLKKDGFKILGEAVGCDID